MGQGLTNLHGNLWEVLQNLWLGHLYCGSHYPRVAALLLVRVAFRRRSQALSLNISLSIIMIATLMAVVADPVALGLWW